jgi:hypothetical protein
LGIWNALEVKTGEGQSVIGLLARGRGPLTETWSTIGIIFIIPVAIAWSSGISDRYREISLYECIYTATLSMLFVLITLELSAINALTARNKDWRGLLIFALCLDIFSVLLLIGPVKSVVVDPNGFSWEATSWFVAILGIAALFASFCVILFANQAGKERNDG